MPGNQPKTYGYVFMSYATAETDFAEPARAVLDGWGCSVYQDIEHLSHEFRAEIARAIDGAAAVVFLMSELSMTRANVLKELAYADEIDKPIIPIARTFYSIARIPEPLRLILSRQLRVPVEFGDPATLRALRDTLVSLGLIPAEGNTSSLGCALADGRLVGDYSGEVARAPATLQAILDEARRVRDIRPASVYNCINLAIARMYAGLDGVDLCRQAVALDEQNVDALHYLGVSEIREGSLLRRKALSEIEAIELRALRAFRLSSQAHCLLPLMVVTADYRGRIGGPFPHGTLLQVREWIRAASPLDTEVRRFFALVKTEATI